MYFYGKTWLLKLVTWMFLKLLGKTAWIILKQELLTMHLQRFGGMSLMISKVIFGLLGVYYMSLQLWSHHFKHQIWTNFLKKSLKEFIQIYLAGIQRNSDQWLNFYWMCPLITGLLLVNIFLFIFFRLDTKDDFCPEKNGDFISWRDQ